MKLEMILDLNLPIDPDNPSGCVYLVTCQPYRPALSDGYKRYKVIVDIPDIPDTPVVGGSVVGAKDGR